jgi:hypothetical protein
LADPAANDGAAVPRPYALAAAALLAAVAAVQTFDPQTMRDFFIYRLGSELTARGEVPYFLPKIRLHAAARFPDERPTPESFVNNCGYFLPPQAAVLFLPFAALPWAAAKLVWALLHGAAGYALATLPNLFVRGRPAPGLIPKAVPFLVLLNFLTLAVVMVGQVTVVSAGCVAAGLWCFARATRAWGWCGVLLWSAAFVKPHLAVPLVPLAWYLGGWRRAGALVVTVAGLNLVGAGLIGGSPLYLRDYLAFLSENHRAVLFNRAELNPEMTSWNRLLFVVTRWFVEPGLLIEQTTTVTLAGYLVWFGLVLGRCAAAGVKPSAAWALAAAAAGAVWCPQVLGYEAFFLVLVVPWAYELFAAGRRAWGFAAALALGLQALPYHQLDRIGFDFHRPLGVAALALAVLAGPLRPRAARDACERPDPTPAAPPRGR